MKKFLFALLLLPLALFIAGCSGGSDSEEGNKTLRIAVIPKGTTHSFWKSVHAGAVKAEIELNSEGTPVEIIWKGPLQEDQRDSQISVVENFIAQQADGLVLAPLDSKALVSPVKQAQAAGIETVIIDSGLEHDGIVSFCATDNFAGGKLAGDHLAKLIDGKGKVLMLRYQVGSASTEQREAGFLAAMKEHPGIEVVSENQYAGPTRDTAFTAAQNLLNRFGGDLQGVYASNESATNGMLLGLQAIGQSGKIKFVGFDGGDTNLNALRQGSIDGLILQDPMNMGYKGVRTMVAHIKGKTVESRIDTGARLVTAENIDSEEMAELVNPPLDKYLK